MTTTQALIQKQFAYLHPQFDFILAPFTYMKVGGPAEVFLALKKADEIVQVVSYCHEAKIPLTVLGGASNVIMTDEGLTGVVLSLENDSYEIFAQAAEKTIVRVGAGFKTALFVRKTVDDGLTGLEYFLGVPGKVGGAVYNNAHYLSELIGNFITQVEVVTLKGERKWLSNSECDFAYDHSIFQVSGDILLQIEFALQKGDLAASQQMIKEATLYRAQTQPLGEPSSGCYFRNIPNTPDLQRRFPQFAERRELPAAYLIDQAGLKGQRIGDIEVSQKHAAFLINKGQGTSADIEQLAELIKQRIREKYHVELEPEVFFLKNN